MEPFIIDMNKKNMPEWDVVKATPIRVPLDQAKNGKALIFDIPTVETYFDFEANYTEFLALHFVMFSQVRFLSYNEFSKKTLKEQFFNSLKSALVKKAVQDSFKEIILKYFSVEGLKPEIKKLSFIKKVQYLFTRKKNKKRFLVYNVLKINPVQFAYCVMLVHNCIEFVKKKFQEMAPKISPQILDIFSTFSRDISRKPGPRFC